ncbi:LysR family transcriptional regulator [Catenulispora rubra]|uniref:LysR family transcriptional regulator n=1 Tax=Catenulispora rubra TaxID=280293 RepID=UPI0018920A80|nr:LysR family transcriptional regulator [Catenulispora rubra]
MPTSRQIEYFVAVAEHGSISRASAELHVSQPALSVQLIALEKELGTRLFERLPHGVRLTSSGRGALVHARAALTASRRMAHVASDSDGLYTGRVSVATVYSVSLGVLPRLIRAWRQAMPGVDIDVHEHRHAAELQRSMAQGEADLAVGPRPDDWPGPVYPLLTERFVVLLGDAEEPVSTLADLAAHRWVHYTPANGLSAVVDRVCADAGFVPRIAVRTEQTASAVAFAEAGLGPALVPHNVVPQSFRGRILEPDPPFIRELTIYVRQEADALVARLVEIAEHGIGPERQALPTGTDARQ